jgi:hypothetical protein
MTNENKELQTETKKPEIILGYAVGLRDDGNFVFELLGKQNGVVQLLGIHEYAERQVQMLVDAQTGTGLPTIASMLDHLIELVAKNLPVDSNPGAQNEKKES